jgi:hypothetical protein
MKQLLIEMQGNTKMKKNLVYGENPNFFIRTRGPSELEMFALIISAFYGTKTFIIVLW